MSMVMVDMEKSGNVFEWFEHFGLNKDQWERGVKRIVERFFPDLENQFIHIRFLDFSKSLEYCRFDMVFAAFFHHENRGIFINSNPDWRGFITEEKLARAVVHELRHYHQLINGELSTEMQEQYAKNNSGNENFSDSPWERDAKRFEDEYWERAYKLIFEPVKIMKRISGEH